MEVVGHLAKFFKSPFAFLAGFNLDYAIGWARCSATKGQQSARSAHVRQPKVLNFLFLFGLARWKTSVFLSSTCQRKARANRDRRTNPSAKHMQLLRWTILITIVSSEQLSAEVLVRTYGLRWRIETLFKAWKSCFQFGKIPSYASVDFVCALVLARLICVEVFQCLFQSLQRKERSEQQRLSPLKLASLIENLAAIELHSILIDLPEETLVHLTLYHCRYDRRKRKHYYQILADLSLG
jgi:hypothetical protein